MSALREHFAAILAAIESQAVVAQELTARVAKLESAAAPASPPASPPPPAQPDNAMEQWAIKIHAGPTLDLRQMTKLTADKHYTAFLNLAAHAPTEAHLSRLREANDGLLQHWHDNDKPKHRMALDAISNRMGFFAQHPEGKAAA